MLYSVVLQSDYHGEEVISDTTCSTLKNIKDLPTPLHLTLYG